MAALTRGHVAGPSGLGSSAMMLPGRCQPLHRSRRRLSCPRAPAERNKSLHEAPRGASEGTSEWTHAGGIPRAGPPPRVQHGEARDGGSATERPAIVAVVRRLGQTRNLPQDVKEKQMNITAQSTHIAAETDLNLPLFSEDTSGQPTPP